MGRKILLFSDLHAHPWPEFAHPVEGCSNSRLWNCVQVIKQVRNYAALHGIQQVVFGGDLFHKKGVVYTETFNLVAAELAQFAQYEIELLMVDGNHDHADKAGSVHALQALEQTLGNVRTPDSEVGWTVVPATGVAICLFSYCDSRDEFAKRVDQVQKHLRKHHKGQPAIAVFHHGFKGARVGSTLEYRVHEDIDATTIDGIFDFVFSGHYHARQKIRGIDNGVYIGAPMENTRSDRDVRQDRGFQIYDVEKRTLRLEVVNMPRFVVLTQEQLDKDQLDEVQGNYVDAYWHDYPGGVEALRKKLEDAGAAGLNLIEQTKKAAQQQARMQVSPTAGVQEVLEKYLDYKQVDDPDRRDELLRLGMDLLSRAE